MEELLASQTQKITKIYRGLQLEGEVVVINDKEVILDLGSKSEGVLPRRELSPEQSNNLKLGIRLSVFVTLAENESGQVSLSTTRQMKSSVGFVKKGSRDMFWNRFIQAQNQKSRLRGVVLEMNKGGMIVEVDQTRGFLPNSQVGFELLSKSGEGMDKLIGQQLSLTVIEVDQSNNKLIFSQRDQVSEEVKNKLKEYSVNQKVKGKVVAVLPFGLVVDILGVEGLVFISDVSWEKVEDLSQGFNIGQELELVVLGIDESLGRLNLSLKQLKEDPFAKLQDKYPADEVIKAEVVEVNDLGVVFKLEDGIEGFLPAAKMGTSSFEAGKSISVLVDNIDSKRRRINLAPFITSTEGLIYK